MYQEPTVLHMMETPRPEGLVLVFRNGLLQNEQKPMNPGSGDYFLSRSRNEIHFQPNSRTQIGDTITAVSEGPYGWHREEATIK